MNTSTDRIEKQILLKAPRSRVWRALSNAEELGSWFGMNLTGKQLAAGQSVQGNLTFAGYEHVVVELLIERVEPEHHLSWRWHPGAIDAAVDYSAEPTTLVVFELSDVDGGTMLRVVETGFDRLPVGRRADAFRMNNGGWDHQLVNIEQYVAKG